MKRRNHLIFAFFCLSVLSVFATFQREDKLRFNQKDYLINVFPLESLYSDKNKKPEVFNEGTHFTSCYRGYVASWAIEGSKLYLVKLEKEYNKNNDPKLMSWVWREVPVEKVFPSKKYPVFASWYSGSFLLHGEITDDEGNLVQVPDFIVEVNCGVITSTQKTLTEKEAIKIADKAALASGYDTNKYIRPDGFICSNHKWFVYYEPIISSNGSFRVFIDNRTKKAEVTTWEKLMKQREKQSNQRVDPTVKTPVESGSEQGTAGHP